MLGPLLGSLYTKSIDQVVSAEGVSYLIIAILKTLKSLSFLTQKVQAYISACLTDPAAWMSPPPVCLLPTKNFGEMLDDQLSFSGQIAEPPSPAASPVTTSGGSALSSTKILHSYLCSMDE